MNSKTTSILAVVCRIGKLIGALFTIIGMLVLIGTLTGLFKPEQSTSSYGYDDYYGYNYGWNSMEFPDGGDISSSREFLTAPWFPGQATTAAPAVRMSSCPRSTPSQAPLTSCAQALS